MKESIELQKLKLVNALKQAAVESLNLAILSSQVDNIEDLQDYRKIGTKLNEIANTILER